MSPTSLCIVAGEPSGDLHGGLLIEQIRRRHPDWQIWGVGSDRMAEAGCELWQDARGWAVMGFSGVLWSLRLFRRRLHDLEAEIEKRRPTAVILIDYPGFNMRLAPRVHALGIGVFYYIVPQVWAWGQGRVKIFRRHVDRSLVMFPFEKKFFEERGVAVDWVGHPLVDLVKPSAPREALRERFGIRKDEALVTMLPGARVQDFEEHLPVFTAAVASLQETLPGVRAALGLASAMADVAEQYTGRSMPLVVSSDVYDLVTASDLVLTKTGTTTVECALLGTPMVTAYRMGALNYAIARRLVKVPYIAMPNLITGRLVVPELIQNEITPARLASEAHRLLTDPAARRSQLEGLEEVRSNLGPSGATGRAADLICEWTAARE